MEDTQPTVAKMVREAVAALGGSTTNAAVRDWILQQYPGTNTGTIHIEIMGATVNHACRIYYCADRRPRLANNPNLDPFYRPGEIHLRDYLARHLEEIEPGLQLYIDADNDVVGVEFAIPIGRIDILAIDKSEDLVAIELKVAKGPDSVAGQILRYKNWLKKHFANGRKVRGIIIAQHISDKIRYAICEDPDITALEYQIQMKISPATEL